MKARMPRSGWRRVSMSAAAFALIIAVCGGARSNAVRDCGTSDERDGYDAGVRNCVWAEISQGRSVRGSITTYTLEGDPIISTLEYRPSSIQLIRDRSRDRFAAPSERVRTQLSCTSVMKRQWATDSSRFALELSGCAGTDAHFVFP